MQQRLARLRAHHRRLPPLLVDAVLTVLVLAASSAEVLLADASQAAKLDGLLAVSPIGLAVMLRRRFPAAAMLVGLSTSVALGFVDEAIAQNSGAPWLTVYLLVFWFSLQSEGVRLWAGSAAAACLVTVGVTTDQYANSIGEILFGIGVMLGGPVFIGQLLRNRAAVNRAMHIKVQTAEAERARAAELAATEERARVAGELHDVVAHALGAMTVQAAAAHRQAQQGPDGLSAAREAFRAVEDTGREALGELRRLLGVLRRDDDELALAPQPRLAHLADLARRVQASGLPVELEVSGEAPAHLPAGIDLTGYRLVQEALAEARDRAGAGRARVRVEYRASEVLVEVGDDGRADPPRSLLGLRERVRVYGGDLDTTARPGGHRLRARLPVGGAV